MNKKKKDTQPKVYEQNASDCFKISLCNLLQMNPKDVPDFVKLYKNSYAEKAREWLKTIKKGMVYIPFSYFLGSGKNATKLNRNFYPDGRCIALINTNDGGHACYMNNGELIEHTNAEGYESIYGYFVIYDL